VRLGVCYYPEHWPEDVWEEDARRMADMGLTWVRIGEFAWSRLEPEPGRYDFAWLDRALDVLHGAGLKVVLGTPTATPPKWLVDGDPGMLAVGPDGQPRRFGSRRHYCFSSAGYRAQCARIVAALAQRYGKHPAVAAWQTDNEYGCHNTTISYSAAAASAFRRWLEARYGDIGALNTAWGTVFWSQEYRNFEEIDPPLQTVTEANPSHRLDYNRFASDEVVSFNRLQADIIRRLSPGRDVIHNFMGFYTEFDHFAVGADLDVASWDSYPLGFLEDFWFTAEEKRRYLRQGHPDVSAFHHDLYRGCGRGRWWVMEQQPGPVNWAGFNPAPLPGVVRMWTWEALAHGAEVVSYFRWRQAPFAQEQFHAGLNLPDRSEDVAADEVRQVTAEIQAIGQLPPCRRAPVALIFSYEADWITKIQPQGRGYSALRLVFEVYSGLRKLGMDVDIVAPSADLSGYRLVVAPALPIVDSALAGRLMALTAPVLLGPRTASKTPDLHIPPGLPPEALREGLPIRVTRVESLRGDVTLNVTVDGDDQAYRAKAWREFVDTSLAPLATFEDGRGAWYRHGHIDYLATWPEPALLERVLIAMADRAGIACMPLPEGVRMRHRGGLTFAFNSAPEARECPKPDHADFVLGGPVLTPGGVSAWRTI
jgi:beta-galactosidase